MSKSLVLGGNAFDSGLVTPGSIPGTGGFDTFCRNYVYIFFFHKKIILKNVCIDAIGNVIREIKTEIMMFISPAIIEAI